MSDSARSTSVIVAGARTPIGRLLGGLKDLSAAELGGVAIQGALDKAGVQPDQVDYLIMGQVILAGAGQNPARTAGIAAGLPMSMPSITINKVCLSGINAIAMADQLIRAGEHDIVVAGGMESMTQAPHLLPKSREGFKYGNTALVDSMAYDALYDQFTDQAMINLTESCNSAGARPVPRGAGRLRGAVPPAGRAGLEERRSSTTRSCRSTRRPARATSRSPRTRASAATRPWSPSPGCARVAKDGTITAGSASQISDGACAVVVMSKAKAEELGLTWLAEIGAHGQVAGPDSTLQLQPARAIEKAAGKEGIAVSDIDLFELNEAFAAVGIESARQLGVDAGPGQRQRRRDRARPPGRHVRRPDRAPPRAGAAAPRRRHRCGRAVRRRRPGRRPHHPRSGRRWLRASASERLEAAASVLRQRPGARRAGPRR